MSWQNNIRIVETLLSSGRIPPSEEIILLIKRINPTSLKLSEVDKERGYALKGDLQNMLLENYGESFYLEEHPFSDDIVLIKHNQLPTIDACHADIKRLSLKSLDNLKDGDENVLQKPAENIFSKTKRRQANPNQNSPPDALSRAELFLDEYEYDAAREVLTAIRINSANDVPLLLRASKILLEEVGSYDAVIEMMHSQPKSVVKDRRVREILAVTYKNNNMIAEARAIFESILPGNLGKESLYAYADIAFKDGNTCLAFSLLTMADEKEGYITAYASLRKEVENSMLEEAEPLLREALEMFDKNEFKRALILGREALEYYPNCQKARELVRIIDAINLEETVNKLWNDFKNSDNNVVRLAILEQLLENDIANRNKIKELIRGERLLRKNELISNNIEKISFHANKGSWSESFDIIWWLSRQEDEVEKYRYVFSSYPYFTVLYQNKRLQRLPEYRAKELWLAFVNVKNRIATGDLAGCFNDLSELKSYFSGYPEFNEEYQRLHMIEQERVRSYVNGQVALLYYDGCTLAHVEKTFIDLRKSAKVLPEIERVDIFNSIKNRLNELKPRTPDDVLLEKYRSLLLVGNTTKIEAIREKVADKNALAQIDTDVGELYDISEISLSVSFDDAINVDYSPEATKLSIIGTTDCDILLRQDSHTIIVINLKDKKASRYTSPNFDGLRFCDYSPINNTYLFRNEDMIWRVQLEKHNAKFTGSFAIRDYFDIRDSTVINEIFMSTSKPNDYYCITVNDQRDENNSQINVILKDIYADTIKHEYHEVIDNNAMIDFYRLMHVPDKFLISIEGEMRICNKNLIAKIGNEEFPNIIGIDTIGGEVYVDTFKDIKVYNSKYENIKSYENAIDENFYIIYYDVGGICPNNQVIYVRGEKIGYFYNYVKKKYSIKYNSGNILYTKTPSTFYYYEYDDITSQIRIKNISSDLDNIIEWERE